MKKIITVVLLLTLLLFVVGCAVPQVEEAPSTQPSVEEVEIDSGLSDLNDLDKISDELDAVNLDDLDAISLE